MIDDKVIEEIGEIVYKAFADTNNLRELEALCNFVLQNIPPIPPPQKLSDKPN